MTLYRVGFGSVFVLENDAVPGMAGRWARVGPIESVDSILLPELNPVSVGGTNKWNYYVTDEPWTSQKPLS